jgi:hypothetical protein
MEVPNTNQPSQGFFGQVLTTIENVAPLYLNYRNGQDPGTNLPPEWNTRGYLFSPVPDGIPQSTTGPVMNNSSGAVVTNQVTMIGGVIAGALILYGVIKIIRS